MLLNPWQLGIRTDLMALFSDEDDPCLGTDAAIGQLVANHSVYWNLLGNKGHAAR